MVVFLFVWLKIVLVVCNKKVRGRTHPVLIAHLPHQLVQLDPGRAGQAMRRCYGMKITKKILSYVLVIIKECVKHSLESPQCQGRELEVPYGPGQKRMGSGTGKEGSSKASAEVQLACNGAACTTLLLHPKMASLTLRQRPWEQNGLHARRARQGGGAGVEISQETF